MIDSNGKIVKSVDLGVQIGTPPLVTGSNVFVMGAGRFYTFDLFLNNMTYTEYGDPNTKVGWAGLAIGPGEFGADGNVYYVGPDQLVAVYPVKAVRPLIYREGSRFRASKA